MSNDYTVHSSMIWQHLVHFNLDFLYLGVLNSKTHLGK